MRTGLFGDWASATFFRLDVVAIWRFLDGRVFEAYDIVTDQPVEVQDE